MDLISRQALRDAMYHEAFETDTKMQRWDSGCWIRYKLFENVIDNLPSAQQWIDKQALLDRLKQAEMFNEDIPEWVWKVIEGM